MKFEIVCMEIGILFKSLCVYFINLGLPCAPLKASSSRQSFFLKLWTDEKSNWSWNNLTRTIYLVNNVSTVVAGRAHTEIKPNLSSEDLKILARRIMSHIDYPRRTTSIATEIIWNNINETFLSPHFWFHSFLAWQLFKVSQHLAKV